jgi:hypothetical protein
MPGWVIKTEEAKGFRFPSQGFRISEPGTSGARTGENACLLGESWLVMLVGWWHG